jgi:transporter family-2 protein
MEAAVIDAPVTTHRRFRFRSSDMDERAKQRYVAGMKWMYILLALVSFAVGTLCLLAYVLATRVPMPPAGSVSGVPWWGWTGGALGAFFVFSSIVLAAQLGAAATMAWLLAGQFLAALVLDHYGLVSFAVREVSWPRILGVGLLIAGALLVNKY